MLWALLVLWVALSPRDARAEGSTSDTAAPEEVAGFVGEQPSGLPGVGRVAVISGRRPHVAAAIGAGYGFTEALGGESGSHHGLSGSAGFAVQPWRFFSAALVLDGRYDKHPDDVLGSSSSAVGEPRLIARVGDGIGRAFALGAQVVLWVPGGDAPSVRPEAATFDASALLTFAPPGAALAAALNAGYRIDRSAGVIDDRARARLRPGDRLTLRASDFDAVLLGLGVSKRLGDLEVLGELTWDVLVGSGAPSPLESPLRGGAGLRYHTTVTVLPGDVQLELRSEVGLGERPAPSTAFSPIEPRVAILAGLRWVLPLGPAPERKTPAPPAPARVAPPPAAPAVVVSSVRGSVLDEKHAPIAGARVKVTSLQVTSVQTGPTTDGSSGDEHVAEAGADGSFTIDGVRTGRVRIVASASGYRDASVEANVEAGTPSPVELVMSRTVRPGQLRGLVRSFSGKPLAATIRVEPIGIESKTGADGTFQIDVPPGSYEVVVAAPGHTGQRRPIQVEENGVTILNADLRPGQ